MPPVIVNRNVALSKLQTDAMEHVDPSPASPDGASMVTAGFEQSGNEPSGVAGASASGVISAVASKVPPGGGALAASEQPAHTAATADSKNKNVRFRHSFTYRYPFSRSCMTPSKLHRFSNIHAPGQSTKTSSIRSINRVR